MNRRTKSGHSMSGVAGGIDGSTSMFQIKGAMASPLNMTVNPDRRSVHPADVVSC